MNPHIFSLCSLKTRVIVFELALETGDEGDRADRAVKKIARVDNRWHMQWIAL